jgi:hypothetical protein
MTRQGNVRPIDAQQTEGNRATNKAMAEEAE